MSDWKMVMQNMIQISKRDLAPGLAVYSDVIPGYDQIISYTEMIAGTGMAAWEKSEIGGNSIDTILFEYPEEFKDPNDQAIMYHERMSIVFGSFLGFPDSDYIQSNERMMLMKYSDNAEFPLSGSDEDDSISVMYYLNDDYEGGVVTFPNLGVSYTPKANEALVFSASKGFEYTVEKVTSGTKYAVLTYLR
jgi:hypothetical protein